jgi:hypothetical protein
MTAGIQLLDVPGTSKLVNDSRNLAPGRSKEGRSMTAGIRLLDVAGWSEVGADNVLHGVESSCCATKHSCECPFVTNPKK